MTPDRTFTRRRLLTTASLATTAGLVLPRAGRADPFREIGWEDLIPPGVPYSEIIAEGEMDERADRWKPVFDANATKFNTALDGERVKLPGYILPIDLDAKGVTSFILVPYMGACIHVPPPPPNQLVFVTTKTPWPSEEMWDAVWVSGRISAKPRSTEVAEIGYEMTAAEIEIYEWL